MLMNLYYDNKVPKYQNMTNVAQKRKTIAQMTKSD